MSLQPSSKAALRGEPSYVWRAGQERRLGMIQRAAGSRLHGKVLEAGCGVGIYIQRLAMQAKYGVGLEIDLERASEAHLKVDGIVGGAGEYLPFPDETFDLILSHEVLEHVQDDRGCVEELSRTLRTGGRLILFVPNRGYPFETHGIYHKGKYHFGNKFLVNWLPKPWRNTLAPHVRVYARRDIGKLLEGLPLKVTEKKTIFGAYDNIIARLPGLGKTIRGFLQWLEKTPLKVFGLSHFWVIEKE